MEIWKDIKDFEGIYQVSNYGNVKSLERYVNKGCQLVNEKILKPMIDYYGYTQVALCKDGKRYRCKVHRLVCEAFLPNPENKPCVDHINCVRSDNRLENLRWCTYSENNKNPLTLEKFKRWVGVYNKFSKSILQFDLDGNLIEKWDSMMDVERELEIPNYNISRCCRGLSKVAGGYVWKYYDHETYLIGLMNKNFKILRDAS